MNDMEMPWKGKPQRRELDEFLELVMRRLERRMLAKAMRVTSDWHEAEDAVQTAIISLARSLASGSRIESLEGWLTVAVRAAALNLVNNRKTRQTTESAGAPASSNQVQIVDPDLPDLHSLLPMLPPREREAIHMMYIEGFSAGETARKMGVSPGSVRGYCHRAIKSLREMLRQERVE